MDFDAENRRLAEAAMKLLGRSNPGLRVEEVRVVGRRKRGRSAFGVLFGLFVPIRSRFVKLSIGVANGGRFIVIWMCMF